MEQRIDPRTRMGTVALVTPDLARSVRYYTDGIGLRVHQWEGGVATLGVGGEDLLRLIEQPGAGPVKQGRTGLYHFALLVPSRLELARVIQHLGESKTPVGGSSDHGVSEALYLTDPDGHGIEIYRDRPRTEWPREGDRLQMLLEPLDFRGIMGELNGGAAAWTGMAAGTTMGHVHLHVADTHTGEAFYVGVLGFDLIARYGGQASFIAAGGYHHHLGINTWAGFGAPPPPEENARLAWYSIVLPDQTAFDEVRGRVAAAGIAMEETDEGWTMKDPSQNTIHLRC